MCVVFVKSGSFGRLFILMIYRLLFKYDGGICSLLKVCIVLYWLDKLYKSLSIEWNMTVYQGFLFLALIVR